MGNIGDGQELELGRRGSAINEVKGRFQVLEGQIERQIEELEVLEAQAATVRARITELKGLRWEYGEILDKLGPSTY